MFEICCVFILREHLSLDQPHFSLDQSLKAVAILLDCADFFGGGGGTWPLGLGAVLVIIRSGSIFIIELMRRIIALFYMYSLWPF